MPGYKHIVVRGTQGNSVVNRVALSERHPDHPGGEAFVAGRRPVLVAETPTVKVALREGRLEEVEDPIEDHELAMPQTGTPGVPEAEHAKAARERVLEAHARKLRENMPGKTDYEIANAAAQGNVGDTGRRLSPSEVVQHPILSEREDDRARAETAPGGIRTGQDHEVQGAATPPSQEDVEARARERDETSPQEAANIEDRATRARRR